MNQTAIEQATIAPAPLAAQAHVETETERMVAAAAEASAFLKALAHEGRLLILCHLSAGERTVSELEDLLGQRQAAVSQQLARLRAEGLVTCRRDGKARLYAIADPRASELVGTMYRLFCAQD